MIGKRLMSALLAGGLGVVGLLSAPSPANAEQFFGGNVGFNWNIPNTPAGGLSEISFPITLNPGSARILGNYAAFQFQFTKSGLAYTGLQPQTSLNGRSRIHGTFSSFIAGSSSSDPNCSNGADGGPGISCGVDFFGTYGHKYLVVVSRTGTDTWTGTARDTVTGAAVRIGTFTLPAGSGNLRGTEGGFVENWQAASCAAVPKIDVTVDRPYSDPARLAGDVGGAFEYGACLGQENFSAVPTTQGGIRIQRGKATGAIVGLGTLCVDVYGGAPTSGTPLVAWTCTGNQNQQWISTSANTLQSMNKCMDVTGGSKASGTPIELWDCNGGGAQVWVPQSNGALLNPQSGKCLDISNSGGVGTKLILWPCTGGANQRWSLNN